MAARNSTLTPRATHNQPQAAVVTTDDLESRSYLADCNDAAEWHAANNDFREINDLAADALAKLKQNDLDAVRALLEAIADRSDSAGDEADALSLVGSKSRH